MKRLLLYGVVTLGCWGLPVWGAVDRLPIDGAAERRAYSEERAEAFLAGDWQRLADEIAEAREKETRFVDGTWALDLLYSTIDLPRQPTSRERWEATMEKWRQEEPDALTRIIVEANAMVTRAWDARGSGWAYTVTEEGWQLFRERLAEARTMLEGVPEAERNCPHWYRVMQTIAMGQGWKWREYRPMLLKAMEQWPEYYGYYFAAAHFLMPRWHGNPGDVERFTAEVADTIAAGNEVYARVAWVLSRSDQNVLEEYGFDWERVRDGFEKMRERNPDSIWVPNNFARFALDARDAETVSRLLPEIDAASVERVWDQRIHGQRLELFRATGYLPVLIAPDAETELLKETSIYSLACFPDNERVLLATNDGRYIVRHLRKVENEREGKLPMNRTRVAISDDGRWVAIAAGNTRVNAGRIEVFDAATWESVHLKEDFAGYVEAIHFLPNNRELVAVGGTLTKSGFIERLDVTTGEWTSNPAAAKRRWHFIACAYDAVKEAVLVDWGTRVYRLTTFEEDDVEWTKGQTPPFVFGMVAPREGDWIYVLRGSESSAAAFHDVGLYAMERETLRLRRGANSPVPHVNLALHGGEVSPDGRYLAAYNHYTQFVMVIDLEERKWGVFYIPKDRPVSLAFLPDGSELVVGGHAGNLLQFQWAELLERLPWHAGDGEVWRDRMRRKRMVPGNLGK